MVFFDVALTVVFLNHVETLDWSKIRLKMPTIPPGPAGSHGFTLSKANLLYVTLTVGSGAPNTVGADDITSLPPPNLPPIQSEHRMH